jgi:hypothetical protein
MRFQRNPSPSRGWRAIAVTALAVLATAAGAPGGTTQDQASGPACDVLQKLPGAAQAEVLAVARILAIKPAMAIDFSSKTGEMCLNTGGPVMTHYSTRPADTGEDIVYFIDAAPLVAKGLRLSDFPAIDPQQGKMKPGAWYRYEGKGEEPHHGMEMKDRSWLIVAIDVQ